MPGVSNTPFIDVIVNALPSTSVSFTNGVIITGVSSFIVIKSSTATGGSFTGVTVMIWRAEAVSEPSVITYGKFNEPVKFKLGVKVIIPTAVMFIVPLGTKIICAIPGVSTVPLIDTTVRTVPFGSLSAVSGNNVTGVSSFVV